MENERNGISFASGQWPPLRLRVCKWFNVYPACKFICNRVIVGAHSVRPHFVKWVRTNSEHQDKMVRKTKPSRLFFIRNTLTQIKRTARLGQSFLQ